MGRFTSVQGFADNNSNNRTITYDQAKGSNADGDKSQKVVTEKVVNPYGSTAGAGSGEFHIYRHARAREMARWNALDQEAKEKQEELNFQASLDQDKKERETKAEKNRRKRQREKEAKRRKKVLKASGIDLSSQQTKKSQEIDEEEFTYIPMAQQKEQEKEQNDGKESTKQEDTTTAAPSIEIPNDGSFLEMMKRKLQEEQEKKESETNDKGSSTGEESATKEDTANTANADEESDEEGPALPPILAKK